MVSLVKGELVLEEVKADTKRVTKDSKSYY